LIKVLFICHGNICRSPMAEYIFKFLAFQQGISAAFDISSAATSREEIGNDIYSPAKEVLRRNGVPFERHAAHQVTRQEMEFYDWILIMDGNNRRNLRRMFGDRFDDKIHMLMEYAGECRDVADPWYTDDFDGAYWDILAGCSGLLEYLRRDRQRD